MDDMSNGVAVHLPPPWTDETAEELQAQARAVEEARDDERKARTLDSLAPALDLGECDFIGADYEDHPPQVTGAHFTVATLRFRGPYFRAQVRVMLPHGARPFSEWRA